LAKSARHAHFGRNGDVHLSRRPPIATYRQDQWEELLAAAADRDTMDETWEKWNAGIEELIAGLEARSIPSVRVLLDVEEIKQFCEEQGIPNDAKARSNLAIRKPEQNPR
jgi:hypothetical protein